MWYPPSMPSEKARSICSSIGYHICYYVYVK
jgi:hypothetical protein